MIDFRILEKRMIYLFVYWQVNILLKSKIEMERFENEKNIAMLISMLLIS